MSTAPGSGVPLCDLQAQYRDLRPELEAPALDVRAHAQVVDVVVAREPVPPEREVRLERRRLERLILLRHRGKGRGRARQDQEGSTDAAHDCDCA